MNLYERGYLNNLSLLNKALEKGLIVEYLDIETSTNIGLFYGHKKLFINRKQIKVPMMLTSAVIMSEKDLKPEILTWKWKGPLIMDYKGVTGGGDDTELLNKLVRRLNKADLIIAQNGDRYDVTVIQERLRQHGLKPLKNIISFDTLKASKRSFYKVSHSLDSRSFEYGLGGKIKQDMDDCIAVSLGDPKRQELRVKYNVKDVTDMRKVMRKDFNYYNLEQKFLNFLRSFIKEDKPYCVKCAARRQKKFELKKIRVKLKKSKGSEHKWECQNCLYRWKIK